MPLPLDIAFNDQPFDQENRCPKNEKELRKNKEVVKSLHLDLCCFRKCGLHHLDSEHPILEYPLYCETCSLYEIRIQEVLLNHSMRIEERGIECDCISHDLSPCIPITIEHRQYHPFQLVIKVFRVL